MNATQKLNEWTRKYYSYKITCGPNIMPGDGMYIKLWNDLRYVDVSQEELEDLENEIYPTLDDLIIEALRKWEADDKIKNFEAFWMFSDKEEDPLIINNNLEIKQYGNTLLKKANLKAKNEKEATELIKSCYDKFPILGKITFYERREFFK